MVADYDHYSHDELFAMVRAGHPDQVEAVAAIWSGLAATADDFARELDRDLRGLAAYWAGAAGAEYTTRLASMARFSRDIATETGHLGSGLTLLAQLLREAQAKIEDPADTDDHDKAASYAATGAKFGSVVGPAGTVAGAIGGGLAGWLADDEEAAKAKVRTVKLVKELAAGYEVHGPARQVEPPKVPVELPQSVRGTAATSTAVGAGAAAAYSGTHAGIAQQRVAHAPVPATAATPGTTHAGARPGSVTVGTPDAGSPIGTGLAGAGGRGLTAIETDPRTRQDAFGGLNAAMRGAQLDGHGGGSAGGAAAPGSAGAAPGTGLAGSSPGSAGAAPTAGIASARVGTPPVAPLTGGRPVGSDLDDEPDERLTWLTEDEMAWGDAEPAVPTVLGRREAE